MTILFEQSITQPKADIAQKLAKVDQNSDLTLSLYFLESCQN